MSVRGLVVAAVAVLLACAGITVPAPGAAAIPWHGTATDREPRSPLAGRVVILDPGHQLGNSRFPRQISRLVPAGGFRKPCNTTGTSTNAGYAEATFNWQVTQLAKRRLEAMGARVVLTRQSNSRDRWGPCVDVRGRAGNQLGRRDHPADLKLSIHADGSYARGARGFHVIVPPSRRPWTHDIAAPSRRLALDLRRALRGAGIPVANYVAGGDGLDVRADLGTLNLSDVPTAMLELGNMRNAGEARRMTSHRGRTVYADAVVRGVLQFLR